MVARYCNQDARQQGIVDGFLIETGIGKDTLNRREVALQLGSEHTVGAMSRTSRDCCWMMPITKCTKWRPLTKSVSGKCRSTRCSSNSRRPIQQYPRLD